MSVSQNLEKLRSELPPGVELVLVSKTHPAGMIMEAYGAGQRIFGESRPQEMKAKREALPGDIRWHMIGHLQTNKVKYIAPFVELIHSGDSERLLETIDAQARKNGRTIDVLLQIHVAREESKEGWQWEELIGWLSGGRWRELGNIRLRGVMGIATNTGDTGVVRDEFRRLAAYRDELRERFFDGSFDILSMGMTSDYMTAVECGGNMVRIGSLVFGDRDYGKI